MTVTAAGLGTSSSRALGAIRCRAASTAGPPGETGLTAAGGPVVAGSSRAVVPVAAGWLAVVPAVAWGDGHLAGVPWGDCFLAKGRLRLGMLALAHWAVPWQTDLLSEEV